MRLFILAAAFLTLVFAGDALAQASLHNLDRDIPLIDKEIENGSLTQSNYRDFFVSREERCMKECERKGEAKVTDMNKKYSSDNSLFVNLECRVGCKIEKFSGAAYFLGVQEGKESCGSGKAPQQAPLRKEKPRTTMQ